MEDEEIISQVADSTSANPIPQMDQGDDDDDEAIEIAQPISKREAMVHLEALRMYFLSSKDDKSALLSNIDELEEDILKTTANKQTNITNFFLKI